jgi:hypothetical protein
MLEHAAIIALLVLSIWYTMQEGEIFGALGTWLYNNLPKKIHPAVFECNICMTIWYGSAIYWLFPWERLGFGEPRLIEWPIVVIVAMSLNIVINKWSPDKDGNVDAARLDEIEQRLDANGIYK